MRRAIRLDRKLILQEAIRRPNDSGGFSETWATRGIIWAAMRAGTGRTHDTAGATLSYTPYRIIVPAAPQGAASRPKPGQRFREGTRLFHVRAVSELDGNDLYLECFTIEEAVP